MSRFSQGAQDLRLEISPVRCMLPFLSIRSFFDDPKDLAAWVATIDFKKILDNDDEGRAYPGFGKSSPVQVWLSRISK